MSAAVRAMRSGHAPRGGLKDGSRQEARPKEEGFQPEPGQRTGFQGRVGTNGTNLAGSRQNADYSPSLAKKTEVGGRPDGPTGSPGASLRRARMPTVGDLRPCVPQGLASFEWSPGCPESVKMWAWVVGRQKWRSYWPVRSLELMRVIRFRALGTEGSLEDMEGGRGGTAAGGRQLRRAG